MNRSIRWFLIILTVSLLALISLGCQKPKPEVKKLPPPTKLQIFALDEIRTSGFETVVLKDFADQHNTDLKLTLFPDFPALLAALNSPEYRGKVDVVLGVDNAFAITDSLLDVFSAVPEIALTEVSFEVPKDPSKRLVPYAYAHLALVYNSKVVSQPPQSFGELQDSRFYSQLAICDPLTTGLGRSSLLWSVSLFGDSGFDQLWTSLRKNIRKVYPDRWVALEALRKGECGLMLGLQSTPAWVAEFFPAESNIQAIVPQEGSFLYVESAALCTGAPNRATGLDFLRYLISADVQQFVMFKLGMLPVNGRTSLIKTFEAIPKNAYAHNQRLNKVLAREQLPAWLESWNRMNNRLPGF